MSPSVFLFSRSKSFWYGASLPLRALRLIAAKPKLIVWSLIPVVITLALYTYLIRAAQQGTQDLLHDYFVTWGWDPSGWGAWFLVILSKLLLLLIGAFTFSITASIIASPFNDFLAESAEPYVRPPLLAVQGQSIRFKLRLIGLDLIKSVAAGIATLFALLFSWIPVLNILALILAFVLVTFQYVSYPQTRRGIGLGEGTRFLRAHFFACLGFGCAFTALFSLPIVSSLALPLAVVGGTLLYARGSAPDEPFPLK
jgi:CysZ protein